MPLLTFDAEYGQGGTIGMTLAVTEGPMRIPGTTFDGSGTMADGTTFTFEGTSGEREGDFGLPEAEGWFVELVSEDHVSGTARYLATPSQ